MKFHILSLGLLISITIPAFSQEKEEFNLREYQKEMGRKGNLLKSVSVANRSDWLVDINGDEVESCHNLGPQKSTTKCIPKDIEVSKSGVLHIDIFEDNKRDKRIGTFRFSSDAVKTLDIFGDKNSDGTYYPTVVANYGE